MSVEEDVLRRIKPTKEDESRIAKVVEELVERVLSAKSAESVKFEPCLVGSIAKGTHLKDPDIDLFLLFDPSFPRKKMDKVGVAVGREAIGGREHYAEHPYIRGVYGGFKVDIVPAYKILDSSKKMTAVDRTPFHTEYIRKHLADERQDHVRLLKRFMKGIGIYGAEAKVEGFSGYLCELLVLRFGSFRGVLEAATKWHRGQVIKIGAIPAKKFDSPLTFIDPVDHNRNVASAVSIDSLSTFMVASAAYLASPGENFFFPADPVMLEPTEIRERLSHKGGILSIIMEKPDIIDDILYPQIRKAQRNMVQALKERDFDVVTARNGVYDDKIVLLIEVKHFEMPMSSLHEGPPVWIAENSEQFLAKWKDSPNALTQPFMRDGQWHVFVKRKYTNALELLKNEMPSLDIGKDLNKLKSGVSVNGPDFPDEPAIIAALSALLDKRMSWER